MSTIQCTHRRCHNFDTESVEEWPTVIEYFCRVCKRYFSIRKGQS